MMKKVGFVVSKRNRKLSLSDQSLVNPLKSMGFAVTPLPWDDSNIKWIDYETLIIRACWNYPDRYDEFLAWLTQIQAMEIKVWNPTPLLIWNSHKKYLLDLQMRGIPTVEMILVDQNSSPFIPMIFDQIRWPDLVIKPAVGATSRGVKRFSQAERADAINYVKKMTPKTGVIIQPLMAEIDNEGEYKFVFFNKQFSHAILFTPHDLKKVVKPTVELIEAAARNLEAIKSPLLYARVDGLIHNNQLTTMEVELIEPELFLDLIPDAPVRFCQAFKELNDH
jgi:hypothetical protein